MPHVPSRSTSFRRFLISRLFLLIVPILLVGVGTTYTVTYRKARSALLETARQNLTESAIRYGNQLSGTLASLTSDMTTQAQLLGMSRDVEATLAQFNQQTLPYQVHCLQTYQAQTAQLLASTCGAAKRLPRWSAEDWPNHQPADLIQNPRLGVEVLPKTPDYVQSDASTVTIGSLQTVSTLTLRIASPIYQEGQLTQVLVAEVGLTDLTSRQPSSLVGVPVIIDGDDRILSHPVPEQVGRNVQEQRDPKRLEALVTNARQGEKTFIHLYAFTDTSNELLAGYTAIASPLANEPEQQWVIIAFTPLQAAIAEVYAIRRVLLAVLLVMTVLLSIASVVVMLYIARAIARPIERLRDAVLDEAAIQTSKIPRTSAILEFNQLTDAVNSMIRRLVSWTEELEGAWQETRLANQLKNEFFASISDEFRTPLNGLIGSLQILRQGLYDSPEEQAEFLAIAEQKTLRLKDLIDDMLTLSLLERGEAEVDLERVNLGELLQQIVITQRPAAQAKALNFQGPTLPEETLWVYGDCQKLQRVLDIVLDNAIKFTPSGQIELTWQILRRDESTLPSPSGQVARIVIRDTGVGVSAERLQKLFRPFVKAYDADLYRGGKSTGLGLAIARNFMTLMGGDIALASPGLNQGTTVWIDLPMAQQVGVSETADEPA
ncbi:MAG: ATP-binding protein [Cyanobacteria bacterium P01_G01_bin.54]